MSSGQPGADAVPVRPAATVVVLRDGGEGLEVLLVRRDDGLAFHGGSWVFPGGRVDPDDHAPGGDDLAAARRAAVRELREEAGLAVDVEDLRPLSHWTTPPGRVRRFSTWFFACPAPPGSHDVVVDDAEIRAFAWHRPADAVAACEAGEIQLAAPTYVSLLSLLGHGVVADALTAVPTSPVPVFVPSLRELPDGTTVALYGGDAAYPDGDLDAPGPRHRLRHVGSSFEYEREL